jgi:hypothetical protein
MLNSLSNMQGGDEASDAASVCDAIAMENVPNADPKKITLSFP